MRQRPSSAPPTSRVGSGSASPSAPSAVPRECDAAPVSSLQICVLPESAGGVVDPALQQQMDHLALSAASPYVSAEDIFYEKRALVHALVEKHARLRIFELSMQIEAEPHHMLQEALIMHQPGLSDEVRRLLMEYDTAAAAEVHGEEAADALSVDDIINFQLPHELKAQQQRDKQRSKQQHQQHQYQQFPAHCRKRAASIADIRSAAGATPIDWPQPHGSPNEYWSAAGLRNMQ